MISEGNSVFIDKNRLYVLLISLYSEKMKLEKSLQVVWTKTKPNSFKF